MVGLGAILQSNMMGTTVFPNMVRYFSIPQPHVVGSGGEIKLKHTGVLHDSEEMIYSSPNADISFCLLYTNSFLACSGLADKLT